MRGCFTFFLLYFLFGSVSLTQADNSRIINPSAMGIEVAGRGLLYSLGFDRVLSSQLSAGISIGSVSMNNSVGTNSGLSTTIIPVFLNYYLAEDMSSLFLTAGVNWVTNANAVAGLTSSAGNLQFSSSPFQPTFGIGYEYRSEPGYLVRIAGYGIYGSQLIPWGGVTLGYSF